VHYQNGTRPHLRRSLQGATGDSRPTHIDIFKVAVSFIGHSFCGFCLYVEQFASALSERHESILAAVFAGGNGYHLNNLTHILISRLELHFFPDLVIQIILSARNVLDFYDRIDRTDHT
jgi:hypothetical protein